MPTYNFKCEATETQTGTAFFSVEARTEKAARKKLADDASEFFTDFSETDGSTEWGAISPGDWELN